MDTKAPHLPLAFSFVDPTEMQERATALAKQMRSRRTVRDYADKAVPRGVIEACLQIAGSAPNGANRQPWHFAVIESPEMKRKIRLAAEEEERAFYNGRAPQDWLDALAPLGTDENKPFLEVAPYLIAIFAESYGLDDQGNKIKNYYVQESVGIATGMLIMALHQVGLATLTHTPSPMNFLNELLQRPKNERPFLLLVVGYPAQDAQVPAISKKSLQEIASFF
ncbi:MAG: nitroreductase family protein [Myxococcales bacterium]|nr:nitroreductase family protein [Myxococcales bacterium]